MERSDNKGREVQATKPPTIGPMTSFEGANQNENSTKLVGLDSTENNLFCPSCAACRIRIFVQK